MQDIKHMLSTPANRERAFLAIVGLFQGLAIWIIIRIEPQEPLEKAACFGLLAWILSSGLLFQFASTGKDHRRLSAVVTGLGVPFALLTYHVVGQLPPNEAPYEGDAQRVATWCIASVLALYILLPYLQIYHRSGKAAFPYQELYRHSWNNFFLAVLGWFYVGVYWALLRMFASLFQALGIGVIQELISKPSFIAITTGIMGGIGVALAKEHAQIITTLRSIAATVFRSLTPLLVIIVLSFLATLPITGLTPLWATKWASSILLTLVLFILLFVNAVFQDGEGSPPYGSVLRRGVEAMLIAMPILAGLTVYSMNLRIEQYGLTPARYYAIVFAIVLGGYGVGYAWSAGRTTSLWLGGLRRFNVTLSFVVFGLAFALHSPLMDPLKRSAEDQEARLLSGKVDVAHFDFGTMRFDLGHHGQEVLDRLAQLTTHPDYELMVKQLDKLRNTKTQWEWTNRVPVVPPEEILTKLTVTPSDHVLPSDMISNLHKRSNRHLFNHCTTTHPCDIVARQWDNDPELEYVLLTGCGHFQKGCHNYFIVLFNRINASAWKPIASILVAGDPTGLTRKEALLAAQEGQLVFSAAQYHCVTAGKFPKVCDHWGNEKK